MPVLFIGHGSPMNAIEHNEFTKNWNALGKDVQRVKDAIDQQLPDKLINYKSMSSAAQLAVPSTEHYLPLLHAIAVRKPDEPIHYFNDSPVMGSLTMTSIRIG